MLDFGSNHGGGDDDHDRKARRAAGEMIEAALSKGAEIGACSSCTMGHFIEAAIGCAYAALLDQLKDKKHDAFLETLVLLRAMDGISTVKDELKRHKRPN